MKILITGGAGYIGTSLVEKLNLVDEVKEIVVFDNLSNGNYNFFFNSDDFHKVKFIKADILDSFALEKALENIETVIHLAAFVSFPFNHLQNLQYEQINTWGSLSVVRAIQKVNSVKKVLYISSASVYGFKELLSINDIPNPENAYSISKYNGEKYFKLLENTHKLSIIRPGNVFGYNRCLRLDGIINSFMFQSIVHGNIKIYGDGTQKRPFSRLSFITDSIINTIFNDKNSIEINVEFSTSINEIKDWLLTKIPNLEYQYLNQNQKFSSQSFINSNDEYSKFLLIEFENLKANLCVSNNKIGS